MHLDTRVPTQIILQMTARYTCIRIYIVRIETVPKGQASVRADTLYQKHDCEEPAASLSKQATDATHVIVATRHVPSTYMERRRTCYSEPEGQRKELAETLAS